MSRGGARGLIERGSTPTRAGTPARHPLAPWNLVMADADIREDVVKATPLSTSWLACCHSPADCTALQGRLRDRIDLDRVLVDERHSYPGGIERIETVPHRLGDYFADIFLLEGASESASEFRLVFQRRPESGRFWKDLMVRLLSEIRAAPQVRAITLDSKGDEAPAGRAASSR